VTRLAKWVGHVIYLSERANWTPLLNHVWRTALIIGFVLGLLTGLSL